MWYRVLFICSSVNKHRACFHPLVIVNRAAMNTVVQYLSVQVLAFTCFEFIATSGIAGHIVILCSIFLRHSIDVFFFLITHRFTTNFREAYQEQDKPVIAFK